MPEPRPCNAVPDPGFQQGGAPTLQAGLPTYDFNKNFQKLHEIETIWTRREGGGVSKILLCIFATVMFSHYDTYFSFAHKY